MADKVRIGFIGCGGNARGHMQRTQALDFAEIAAVCDRVPELVEKTAGEYGCDSYTDMSEMLDRARLDGVVISIPVPAHGEPEQACLDRDLPFLVEKPVARDMATARAIEKQVNDKGLITAVGYQLRYGATVDKAKEALAGQPIGLVVGLYWCGTGRMDPNRWTVQYDKSGGQILEQATHTIDMMRYLAGEIEEVHAYASSVVLTDITSPDINVVSWRHANGALGSLTTTWALDRTDWLANEVQITGDALRLTWSFPKLMVKRGDQEPQEYPGGGPSIDEVFCDAVRTGNGSAIRSPYSDGVKTLAVCLAALQSAEEGRVVRPDEVA